MNHFVEGLGITLPVWGDWVVAGAALAIIAAAWFAAHLAGRTIGARLADLWARRAGGRGEELMPRLCRLTRYAAMTILLAVALGVDRWRPLGAALLGLALASAAAIFVWNLMRGVPLARWIAFLLAAAAFVPLLARAIGGLRPITTTLDRIGFDAGKHRVSLLTSIEFAVTIVALYAAVKLLNRMVGHSLRRATGLDPTQQLLAQKLAGLFILVVAFFVGTDLLGIDLTAFTVFSGAFGLAIGFGLQKTFGNLIAGIILLMDRSIKPGDVIVVGDSFGHVTRIGVRAVSIVTRDGKEHLIPNENLMTQEVENWSYSSPNVRVHIPVGIAYDCDVPFAQKLMIQAAKEAKRVLAAPGPTIWLHAFGESSIDHEILVWIADPEAGVGSVRSEILNRVLALFKEHGISIPSPQRDLHIKDWTRPAPEPAPPD
jgi:small-conductance mechanosensitive channel